MVSERTAQCRVGALNTLGRFDLPLGRSVDLVRRLRSVGAEGVGSGGSRKTEVFPGDWAVSFPRGGAEQFVSSARWHLPASSPGAGGDLVLPNCVTVPTVSGPSLWGYKGQAGLRTRGRVRAKP